MLKKNVFGVIKGNQMLLLSKMLIQSQKDLMEVYCAKIYVMIVIGILEALERHPSKLF